MDAGSEYLLRLFGLPESAMPADVHDLAINTALRLGRFGGQGRDYRVVRPLGSRNWLIFATESGGGCLRVTEGVVAVGAGSVAAIAPGTPHDYATDPRCGRWAFAWAHCKPPADWLPLLQWPARRPGIHVLEFADRARLARGHAALREAVACAAMADLPRALEFARNRLHAALLWWHAAMPVQRVLDPRIGAACERIARELARRLPVALLARDVGLSPGRFARLFAAETGLTPRRWIEQQRLVRAAELLRQGQAVAAVARQVGFANAFHFSTRFRRWSGRPPSAEQG